MVRGDDLTPQQALELSSAEARDALDERRADDDARLQDLRSEPGWMVQLSSKCAFFDTVDLEGPDGIGVPDGVAESFAGGIGEAGILAFHLGAQEQWGDTVLLVRGDALDLSPCDDGTPKWLTLDAPASGPYESVNEAMCECSTRGLPFGECGIRATDEDTGDLLAAQDRNEPRARLLLTARATRSAPAVTRTALVSSVLGDRLDPCTQSRSGPRLSTPSRPRGRTGTCASRRPARPARNPRLRHPRSRWRRRAAAWPRPASSTSCWAERHPA